MVWRRGVGACFLNNKASSRPVVTRRFHLQDLVQEEPALASASGGLDGHAVAPGKPTPRPRRRCCWLRRCWLKGAGFAVGVPAKVPVGIGRLVAGWVATVPSDLLIIPTRIDLSEAGGLGSPGSPPRPDFAVVFWADIPYSLPDAAHGERMTLIPRATRRDSPSRGAFCRAGAAPSKVPGGLTDRGLIRGPCFARFDDDTLPHRGPVVECLQGPRVREVEPRLQERAPQHLGTEGKSEVR